MTTIEDPVRVVVPSAVARQLAHRCSLGMDGHEWAKVNVEAAREVLAEDCGPVVVRDLARFLARDGVSSPGWALLALPPRMDDEALQVAAAGLLAGIGRPFNSIDWGRLWIGRESSTAHDAGSFGGAGPGGLHIDAPNVERVPDYTALLVLRPDPAGGGMSLLGDLHAALALLDDGDREALREPVYYEGRADGLRGVGAPMLPFPVLDDSAPDGRVWIRWAAKLLADERNAGRTAVLGRFADALAATTSMVVVGRGQLLVLDQQRIAHGRAALGDQTRVPPGRRRLLVQAKSAYDPAAPAQQAGVR